MIEFRGFTGKASSALNRAVEAAMELGHTYIGSEHILYGLVCEENSTACAALSRYGVSGRDIMHKMELLTGRGKATCLTAADLTPRSKRILENALKDASGSGSSSAGTGHILRAVIKDEDCCGSVFLKELGADTRQLTHECSAAPHNTATDTAPAKEYRTTALERFGRDLTGLAREGKLDPVISREKEISAAVNILLRRRKNNPCLIGESGVGKTAVAEGIANLIADGSVPAGLENTRIFSLDITSMVAGAKYRGDFEERIKTVIDEVKESPDTVLFIDEVHTLVGAGAAEGAVDAANILKPVLARGELRIIGATTSDEYRRYIEKDAALSRRFRPVIVEEPDENTACAILKGIKGRYEEHHGVTVSDEAIEAAVKLSVRYIPDRRLPDKAIDLIDESCAAARLASPMQNLSSRTDIRQRLRQLATEKERAVLRQDFGLAAEIREREMKLQRECDTAPVLPLSSRTVTAKDIALTASRMTGIPAAEIERGDAERVLRLEDELKKHIIGQDDAVRTTVSAVKRGRAGISRRERPAGSFIFAGPTGVGKTELAKTLSRAMTGSNDALIRFDMSEYMEKHSVSGLIGAPAGYVGYEDGGRLVEAVKRHPYSVLLFDEIEKAHSDVLDILLQVLDDGRLTSADGTSVSLRNCIIIMTTNVGARCITEKSAPLGFISGEKDETADIVNRELIKAFRPEFINRVDAIVVFRKLSFRDDLLICRKMLDELRERAAEAGVYLTVTDAAAEKLVTLGCSDRFGARSLSRTITKYIEDPLADAMLRDPGLKEKVFDACDL